MMNNILSNITTTDYCVWKDILIPLICALFGGLVTFVGIFITIKYENKKSRKEYTERIRPFIVIESAMTTNADLSKTVDVVVNTEAERDEKIEGASVYRFDSFLFTNCGEAVFTVNYLKINDRKYKCIYKTSIKQNDIAQVCFKPIQVFQTNLSAKSIRIGVTDRLFNQYEYELLFEITDNTIQDSLASICQKCINIKSCDCSKNQFKKDRKMKKTDK